MSTALNAYRARVGRILDGPLFLSGAATSGSTTTLVDTSLLKNAYWGPTVLGGAWVLLTANSGVNRQRMIDSYAPLTGTLTWTQALGAAITTDAYEVSSLMPTYLEAMINEALERVYTVEEVTVAPAVNNDRQIDLSTITWLTAPEDQFIELVQRVGSVSSQYDRLHVNGVEVWRDEDTFTLNLAGQTFLTTDTLVLRAYRPYSTIGTMATPTATSTAPLDWVAWEAAREILERLLVDVATEESGALARKYALAVKRVAELRSRYMPVEPMEQGLWEPLRHRYGPIGIGLGRGCW